MHTGAESGSRDCPLGETARLDSAKVLGAAMLTSTFASEQPVLLLLAAGKGTRFGEQPKCAQMVRGRPLARHSVDSFRRFSRGPVLCVVGYRYEEVAAAVGTDVVCIRSENPTGGTAFAAYEAFSVPALERANPVVLVSMGDRVVPTSVFERLFRTHEEDGNEADLTFLTAVYEPPRHFGKGRILRDSDGSVSRILEQKDIDAIRDERIRGALNALTEANCPLYAARARSLRRWLERVRNDNAQDQYYLTDIVREVHHEGGRIRTLTTTTADPEYDLLCADVTRPLDLALLEAALGRIDPEPAEPSNLEGAAPDLV